MRAILAAMSIALALPAAGEDAIKVHAAGSLKAALSEAGAAFAKQSGGAPVEFVFAPSGLIKERLEKGEKSDLFASANMAHPKALADAGLATPVRAFARNTLCALASPKVRIAPATVLETILDPAVKLGISTPKADPAGDYAWQLFANAGQLRPGAREKLEAKALQLTGGPNPAPVPKDRNAYGYLVEQGAADVYLTYCTNGILARKEVPALQVVAIGPALNVGADYGLAVMKNAKPAAARFADYLVAGEGRAVLERHGFEPPR